MAIRVIKKFATLALIPVVSLFVSCDDVNNLYCDITSRLYISNVSSYPILATACTSLGEFCTITLPGSTTLKLTNYTQTGDIPITADMKRNGVILGLNGGLIVGLPNVAEQLRETSQVVCFDLACPNCYVNYNIAKLMSMTNDNSHVYCSSCKRTYDLNSSGIVSSGDVGRALLRHFVTYYSTSMTLYINNR